MKKLLMLILVLAGVSLAASAQNLMTVDLTNGNTLTGYVSQQADGGYLVETTDGDTFYFSSSEVRRVYDPSVKQDANAVYTDGRMVYRKGSKIRYLDDNSLLGESGFANYLAYDKYTKASSLKRWGDYTLAFGVLFGLAGIGELADISAGESDGTYLWTIPTGASCLVAGAVMELIGVSKLNKIVKTRNNANHYSFEVELGPTPNGFGIAMKF